MISQGFGAKDELFIPGESYDFGELLTSQVHGDYLALEQAGRRVLHLVISSSFNGDVAKALQQLVTLL